MSYAGAVAFVLEREGGFVSDAADRGGATKYGITHATLARARRAPVTVGDVRALRISEAVDIYERDYWRAARCPDIPHPTLALCHFDAAVNHGVGRAVRFLQGAIGVTVDGGWGPKTQAAVAACGTG